MEKINSYISRLSSVDISVQESSLRTLINYSIEPQLLLTIYNEIKVETFQSLLKSENEVIQMLTIWLLSHLCGSIYISSDVLKSRILIDEVLKLLEIENEDISEKILWFLENLTMNPNHSFLLGEGVIVSLIEFLRLSNSKLIQLVSKPLIHLLHKETCGDYLNNQQIFCQNQGIQVITSILLTKYLPSQVVAAASSLSSHNNSSVNDFQLVISPIISVLHVLSIYLPKIRILIAESPVLLSQLVSLLSMNCLSEIKDTTMMILVNLSLTEEAENPIFEAGAIMPLLDIVASSVSSSEVLRYHAISCLANLTSNPRIRSVLRSRYLIDSLCEILKEIQGYSNDEYSMILGAISVLLSNLCIDEICRYRALQTDIHDLFTKLMNYPHPQVRDSIQRTLENLNEPIPIDILNQLNSELIEDESDGFEDTPLIINNIDTNNNNNNIYSVPSSLSSSSSSQYSIYHTFSSPPQQSQQHSISTTIKKGIYRLSTFTSPTRVSSNNLLNGANSNEIGSRLSSPPLLPMCSTTSPLSPTLSTTPSIQNTSNGNISSRIGSPIAFHQSPSLPPLIDEPNLAFRRGKIIKEIMDTEQSYVHSLGVCIKVYFNPLVISNTNPPILPKNIVETVFSNIDKVFRINCEFLKKLRVVVNLQAPDVMEVAMAFLWLWNQQSTIHEYRHYINGFNKAMESVHENRSKLPRFKEFLDKCQFSDQCKSETIDSYLIRPVQRLPRYILLLSDLLIHTVDMLERNSIEDALEKTKHVVDLLNESKRKAENFTKTLILQQKFTNMSEHESKINTLNRNNTLIQSSMINGNGNGVVYTKQIIREGLLMQFLKSKPSQYRYLILYNDQLFITIQKKDKYHILQIIPLLELKIIYLSNPTTTTTTGTLTPSTSIIDLSNSTSSTNSNNSTTTNTSTTTPENSFQLLWSSSQDTFEREMLLYTTNPEDRDNWVKVIRDTCNLVKKSHLENIIKSTYKPQQYQQQHQNRNSIQVEI